MRRLNFDVASDNERRNVRASIDKFLDRLVDEENDRERLRKMLDDLVIACSEESEPGMSQITGREPAMDASIDEIVDRVLKSGAFAAEQAVGRCAEPVQVHSLNGFAPGNCSRLHPGRKRQCR